MKKTVKILTLVAIIAMTTFIYSCSKDEDGNIVISVPKLSATVGDSTFTSVFRQTNLADSIFTISATTGASLEKGKKMIIIVRGNTIGTYNLDTNPFDTSSTVQAKSSISYWPEGAKTPYLGISGQVEITKLDTAKNKISGTFNFEMAKTAAANDKLNVTNGTFENLNYTKIRK